MTTYGCTNLLTIIIQTYVSLKMLKQFLMARHPLARGTARKEDITAPANIIEGIPKFIHRRS